MDAFTDDELFDESVPHVSLSERDEAVDPLTVSSDNASLRLHGEGTRRRVAYVAAALVILVVVAVAFHAGRSSHGPRTLYGAVRGRHARLRAPRMRRRIVVRHRATAERVPVAVVTAKVVVRVPSSGPERPTRTEGVGFGRPTTAPSVGNTEQFGYLGR